MSNLSIQNLFGPASSDAPARGTRSDGSRDQRDAAQAFNEVMQKHTARAPERNPDRTPERTAERASERPRDPSAERNPNRSHESAAQPSENAAGTSARQTSEGNTSERNASEGNDTADQRTTGTPTNSPAAPTKRTAGQSQTQAKNAEAQDANGPDTATGDLFADLNLALSKAATPTEDATATPAASSATEGAGTAPQSAPTHAAASAVMTSTPGAMNEANADGKSDGNARNAQTSPVIDVANGNAKTGNAAQSAVKKSAEPSGVGVTQDKVTEKTQAKDMQQLLALASAAQPHNTAARSENTPLSLSAALASPPVHAAHGLASTLTPASTFSIAHAQVKTGVGAYGFAEDFSQRVVMLASQRVQSAEIALTPSDLGPVSVSLEMRGQEASLVFGAAQTATRAAIEDALPRLREMFQAQGLHLVEAQVSTQLSQHGQREAFAQSQGQRHSGNHSHHGHSNAPAGLAGMNAVGDVSSSPRVVAQSNRLIDVHV